MKSKINVKQEQRIGKFVRDFSIVVQDERSVNYNILRNMLRELLNSQDQEGVKNPEYDGIREVERQKFKNIVDTVNKRYPQDTPEEMETEDIDVSIKGDLFRMERMDDDQVWVAIYRGEKRNSYFLTVKDGNIELNQTEEELPNEMGIEENDSKDTPEEWEKELGDLVEKIDIKKTPSEKDWLDKEYKRATKDVLVAFVQQLLDDRERKVYVDGYKDGITRCMESLDKLLNSKKK